MRFLSTLLPAALLVACIDSSQYELSELEANPELSIPLGFGTLTIQDLINDSQTQYLKVAPDGLLYLQYTEELRSADIRGLFDIPAKTVNRGFILPSGTYPAINRDVRLDSITETVDLGLAPEKLSEILLKVGKFEYQTSTLPANSNLSFIIQATLPDITKNNVPLNVSVTNTSSSQVDLADYLMKLNQNRFNLKLVLILRSRTQPVTLTSPLTVSFRVVFQSLDFRWIKGFFGDQSVNLPEEQIAIGAFGESLLGATVSFAAPKIDLIVTNEYSVPSQVNFLKLEARKGTAVLPVVLNPPNPVTLNFPILPGASAVTNTNITNTKALLDFAPTSFYYQASARINPGVTTGVNFMADTSKMKVRMNVEIPFFGTANNVTISDTLEVDLSDLNASQLDSTYFKVQATNELPLEAALQFLFANEKAVVFDSLFATPPVFIKASTVNASGDLQAAGKADQRIPIPTAKINQLLNAKKILIRARMNTTRTTGGTQPNVKFRSAYKLQLNLGLQTKLKLNVRF